MSKTIKVPGGIMVRLIEAVNGFRTKYGYWPDCLEAEAESIAFLATRSFTPLGFFLVQSKLEIVIGPSGKMLTRGREGDVFDYGEEGWQTPNGHKHDACQWLGIDTDESC